MKSAQYEEIAEDDQNKAGSIMKAVLLGTQFLFMFSAFNSASNMIALLFEQTGQDDLGVISIWVLYLVFGIATIFSPNICAKFNPKYVLCVSSFGYTLYLSSGILVSYCYEIEQTDGVCTQASQYGFVIFMAALCGLGASTLWVSQAWYISNLSTLATRGMYFGVFWALMQSSQIVGNVLGMLLLRVSYIMYFLVLTSLCLTSGLSFLLLPNPKPNPPEVKGFMEKVKGMFVIIACRKMRPMLFYYVFAGSIVAFYTGFLYKLIQQALPNDSNKEIAEKAGYVFIVLGLFEFLGGMASGYLSDRVNRYFIATCSTTVVELALVLSIICLYQKSYALCFVTAALWGLSDCIAQNMCTIITSTLFPDQIEGFAISKLVQGITITMIMIMNIYLKDQIIFIMVIALIEIITNVSTAKLGVIGEKK